MPWPKVLLMDQRIEFIRLFQQPEVNRQELCRRFGISPKTAYKWLNRAKSGDPDWAKDRSRRPHRSPKRSGKTIEAAVLQIRDVHPAWGARKIRRRLTTTTAIPSASTVHAILQRNDRVPAQRHPPHYTRFEHPTPNDLWQMDFKGRFAFGNRVFCHPLTMVDDHSRYNLCLQACANEQSETVQQHIERTFGRFGLPNAFLVDNGVPWGTCSQIRWTKLRVWLLKLGVDVVYARPYHPQTKGKNERFHRTLREEVLSMMTFTSLRQIQTEFDRWREIYNTERPHQAIDYDVPASRYRPSERSMPTKLPEVEYEEGTIVRRASKLKADFRFANRRFSAPEAFRGELLAIRPTTTDGTFGVFFGAHQIACIDLHKSAK